MKKRPFVLLEILIAFSLVSLSILPFMRYPFQHMQQELDTLFEMELQRVAQNELATLQALLYQKEIPEKILFAPTKEPFHFRGKVEILLPGGMKRTYQKRAFVSWERQKKVGDKVLVSLINLHVSFLNPADKRKKSLNAAMQVVAQKNL